MKRFIFLLVIFVILSLSACHSREKEDKIPKLPFLTKDSLMNFKVGDLFIIDVSVSGCCAYSWLRNDTISSNFNSSLFKYIKTINEPAASDCDGCRDTNYDVYEFISSGSDSLILLSIDMNNITSINYLDKNNHKKIDSSQFKIIYDKGNFFDYNVGESKTTIDTNNILKEKYNGETYKLMLFPKTLLKNKYVYRFNVSQ